VALVSSFVGLLEVQTDDRLIELDLDAAAVPSPD
jgi:hypothetical protein